jgi:hypothetical protein
VFVFATHSGFAAFGLDLAMRALVEGTSVTARAEVRGCRFWG